MGFHEQIIQLIISGLTIGSIYALIATGFVITYNITGVLNFAQGEFAMLGAMIAISLVAAGVSRMPAFIMAILIVLVSGALFERAAIHPARHSTGSAMIIITIGVAIAVRGIALFIWGPIRRCCLLLLRVNCSTCSGPSFNYRVSGPSG